MRMMENILENINHRNCTLVDDEFFMTKWDTFIWWKDVKLMEVFYKEAHALVEEELVVVSSML